MNEQPPPMTGADCDLSDFAYMELDVRRLRDSKFAATDNAEAFRAGILLWCAAWHQIPAASLPDDDVELANLAGYGRVVKEWKKVREAAMHGFVKCSDGRLYHKVIAEKAATAYAAKVKHAYARFCDRLRKENAKRQREGKESFGIPDIEQWKSGAYPHGIPPNDDRIPAENDKSSTGKHDEIQRNSLLEGTKRERNGEGTITTVPIGTDADGVKPPPTPPPKSPADMTKDELWSAGKSLLAQAGLPAKQCGSFVGKLVKDYGTDTVVASVRLAVTERPADPVEYLKAACMHAAGQRVRPNRQEAIETRNRTVADEWAGAAP